MFMYNDVWRGVMGSRQWEGGKKLKKIRDVFC
jgi:hypothetical protein